MLAQRFRGGVGDVIDAIQEMAVVSVPDLGVIVPLDEGDDAVVVAHQAAQLAGDGPLPGGEGMPVLVLGHGEELGHAGPAIVAGEHRQPVAGGAIRTLQQLAQQRQADVMGLAPAEIPARRTGRGRRPRRGFAT